MTDGRAGGLLVCLRYCEEQPGKPRPTWFSKAVCLDSLEAELAPGELVVLYDGAPETLPDNLRALAERGHRVVVCNCGSDRLSMRVATDVVLQTGLSDTTVVYFVEDDHLHRPGWRAVLMEAFEHKVSDYVTLYDHADKYDTSMYPALHTTLRTTPLAHWRAVPSTVNTCAMTMATFKRDLPIHQQYLDLPIRRFLDHDRFLHLKRTGATLSSCLPGWSTHCHEPYVSPCVDWARIASQVQARGQCQPGT